MTFLPFVVTFADGQSFAVQSSRGEDGAVAKAQDLWTEYNGWGRTVPAVVSVAQKAR